MKPRRSGASDWPVRKTRFFRFHRRHPEHPGVNFIEALPADDESDDDAEKPEATP
jgi:hypothetical protein